jgi:AraC-like DNA-binding protein
MYFNFTAVSPPEVSSIKCCGPGLKTIDIIDENLHNIDMALRISSFLYTRCPSDWRWEIKALPDFDFWYVSSGEGEITIGENVLSLESGTALILPPDTRICASHNPRNPLSVYAVHFMPADREDLSRFTSRLIDIDQPLFILELFHRLNREFSIADSLAHLWFEAILAEFYRNAVRRDHSGSPYSCVIRDMCSRIRNKPSDPWKIKDLAEQIPVSRDHFIRVFKKETGVTPGQYIIEQRLSMAQHLLLESSLTVQRISEICGFDSLPWFSRLFHQKKKVTPGEFRRMYT